MDPAFAMLAGIVALGVGAAVGYIVWYEIIAGE